MYGDTRCTCSASERRSRDRCSRAVALLPRGRTIAFDELVRVHALSTSTDFIVPPNYHSITIRICIRVHGYTVSCNESYDRQSLYAKEEGKKKMKEFFFINSSRVGFNVWTNDFQTLDIRVKES